MTHHAYRRNTVPEQRAQAAQVRSEALQLLAPFLALPADMTQRVHAAVEAVVSDVFPVFSQVGPLHTHSYDVAFTLHRSVSPMHVLCRSI